MPVDVLIERIGRYRILGRIGRGGMGSSVYKAHDPELDRLVALKAIPVEGDVADELRARFESEKKLCAKLSHPNIVTIHDSGEADGHLFIVMELLDGEDLRQLIGRGVRLHLADKLSLMVQLCDGLDHAHRKGVIHRDIKPANLFVQPNGQLKILDFGIARIEAAKMALTRAGLFVGTPRYMAPERLLQTEDHRCDIFSVGAVLYELLTGRPPFEGDNPYQILTAIEKVSPPSPHALDESVPVELDEITARALAKKPEERFDAVGVMRVKVVAVQRRVAEVAERLTEELRAQLARAAELRQALAARLGGDWPDDTTMVVDDQTSLTALQSFHQEAVARVAELEALLVRAEEFEPAVERAVQALAGDDVEAAVSELECVVGDMPEHARAAGVLAEAREWLERQQQAEALARVSPRAPGADDRDATIVAQVPGVDSGKPLVPPSEAPRETAETERAAVTTGAVSPPVPASPPSTPSPSAAPLPPGPPASAVPGDVAAGSARDLVAESALDGEGDRSEAVPREPPALASDASRPGQAPAALTALRAEVVEGAKAESVETVPTVEEGGHRAGEPALDERPAGGLTREAADAGPRARRAGLGATAADGRELTAPAPGEVRPTLQPERATPATDRGTPRPTGRHRLLAAGIVAAALALPVAWWLHARQTGSAPGQRVAEVSQPPGRNPVPPGPAVPPAQPPPSPSPGPDGGALKPAPPPETLPPKPPAPPTTPPKPSPRVDRSPPADTPGESPGRERPEPVLDAEAQIRHVLNRYVKAIETKNLALLGSLRPGADLQVWRRSFEQVRSRKVDLSVHSIDLETDDLARAMGRWEDRAVMSGGQRLREELRFVCILKRGPRSWVIHNIETFRETAPSRTPDERPAPS